MQPITISALIDQAREATGARSDYALCKRLSIHTSKLSNWRTGRNLPDEIACEKLAEAAGLDPDFVIAKMNAQRAKDDASQAIWNRIAARLAGAVHVFCATILAAIVASFSIATDAEAAQSGDTLARRALDSVCVLC